MSCYFFFSLTCCDCCLERGVFSRSVPSMMASKLLTGLRVDPPEQDLFVFFTLIGCGHVDIRPLGKYFLLLTCPRWIWHHNCAADPSRAVQTYGGDDSDSCSPTWEYSRRFSTLQGARVHKGRRTRYTEPIPRK